MKLKKIIIVAIILASFSVGYSIRMIFETNKDKGGLPIENEKTKILPVSIIDTDGSIEVVGVIKSLSLGPSIHMGGVYRLMSLDNAKQLYSLASDSINLSLYEGMPVRVFGTIRESVEGKLIIIDVKKIIPDELDYDSYLKLRQEPIK